MESVPGLLARRLHHVLPLSCSLLSLVRRCVVCQVVFAMYQAFTPPSACNMGTVNRTCRHGKLASCQQVIGGAAAPTSSAAWLAHCSAPRPIPHVCCPLQPHQSPWPRVCPICCAALRQVAMSRGQLEHRIIVIQACDKEYHHLAFLVACSGFGQSCQPLCIVNSNVWLFLLY